MWVLQLLTGNQLCCSQRVLHGLCTGHEDCNPVRRIKGIRNTVAIGTAPNPAILQLIEQLGLSGRLLVTGINDGFTTRFRSILRFPSVDDSHEGTLHGRFNPGGLRTLSRLDEIGADVRLTARFSDLANENVNATKRGPGTRTQLSRPRGPSLRCRCRACRDESWSSGPLHIR